MKVNYIKEGYFNNPEEMKKKAGLRKSVSNTEKKEKNTNDILALEIEKIIDSYLERNIKDEESYSGQYRFLNDSICGPYLSDTFFLRYLNMPEMENVCATSFKSKVVNLDIDGYIDVEIYVHIEYEEWFKHFDERIKYEFECEKERRNGYNIVYGQGSVLNNCEYDAMCALDGMYNTGCVVSPESDSDAYFRGGLKHFVLSNSEEFGNTEISKMLIEKAGNGEGPNTIRLKKIHMFSDVKNDIIFSTFIYRHGPTGKDWLDYSDGIKRDMKQIMKFISFDNDGDIILRDRYHNGDDIVFKHDGTVLRVKEGNYNVSDYDDPTINEGYFKNPGEMKASAEKRNSTTKAEQLAKDSTSLVNNEIERVIDACMTRIPSTDDRNSLILSDMIVDVFEATTLFNVNYEGKNYVQDFPISSYKSKVEVETDGDRPEIIVDVYVSIDDERWITHIKHRQYLDKKYPPPSTRKELNMHHGQYNRSYDLVTYIDGDSSSDNLSTRIRDEFERKIKSTLSRWTRVKEMFNSPIGQMIYNSNIYLNKIHLFSGIEGDIVFSSKLIKGFDRNDYIDSRSYIVLQWQSMLKVISFENTGKIILRDRYTRCPNLVIENNKFVNKTLNEGYFKNPEEMKSSAERKKEISSADKLASDASKVMEIKTAEFIESWLNKIETVNDSMNCTSIFKRFYFGEDLRDLFTISYPDARHHANENFAYMMFTHKPLVKLTPDGKIHVELWTTCENIYFLRHMEAIKINHKSISLHKTYVGSFRPEALLNFNPAKIREDFAIAINMRASNEIQTTNNSDPALSLLANNTIVLDKIHLFQGIPYIMLFEEYPYGIDTREISSNGWTDLKISKKPTIYQKMADLFTIENDGLGFISAYDDCYITQKILSR